MTFHSFHQDKNCLLNKRKSEHAQETQCLRFPEVSTKMTEPFINKYKICLLKELHYNTHVHIFKNECVDY